jgi:hypothetical protein
MVTGNGPLAWNLTCGFYVDGGSRFRPTTHRTPDEIVRAWDAAYEGRRCEAPHVHVCRALLVNVYDPPQLTHEATVRVFPDRRFPGTQTPKRVPEAVIDALAEELGLHLPPA